MLLVLLKAILIYFLVLLCIRLTGKRQLGEMQPFELVVMLMIADLATVPINDPYVPFYAGVIPIIALTFLSIIISLISRKSLRVRRLVDGKSVIVIDRGSISLTNLKKLNMNVHDLLEAVRAEGNLDINAIQYAIFENNGKISIVEKSKDPTAPTDSFLPLIIIADGKYDMRNLELCGLTKQQIDIVLKKNGIINPKEVLFADIRQDGTLYVSPKNGDYFTQNLKIKGVW